MSREPLRRLIARLVVAAAYRLQHWLEKEGGGNGHSFRVEMLHFFGEVAVVFGIWAGRRGEPRREDSGGRWAAILIVSPLLGGFFLAGLVVHGTLQAWWIAPLLARLDVGSLLAAASGAAIALSLNALRFGKTFDSGYAAPLLHPLRGPCPSRGRFSD